MPMKKQYRRLIFIIFVIFFIITIPTILIYTAGYRYNFKKTKFEKTGSLLISSKTKNISLSINNDYVKNGEEFRINNILPGEYLIRLNKENYYAWEKKLSIDSELTTFIKDVRLFEKNLPTNDIIGDITSIYPSIDGKKIAYISKDDNSYSLLVIEIENGTKKEIFNSKNNIEDVRWSPNSEKIIIETETMFKIFDNKNGEIKTALPTPLKSLYWDEKNSNIIYALKNDGIYKVDLLFKNYSLEYKLEIIATDFRMHQNILYLIQNYELKQIDLKNNSLVSVPLERKDYNIKNIINEKIYLESNLGKMQVFDLPLTDKSTPILLVNANNFDLLGNDLLYYNDFELWIFNFNTGQKELITRVSNEIKKAVWVNNNNNIIFTSNGELKSIELDKRDKRQVIELVHFDSVNDLFLNDKFIINFIGGVNGVYGLYKLKI